VGEKPKNHILPIGFLFIRVESVAKNIAMSVAMMMEQHVLRVVQRTTLIMTKFIQIKN